MSHNVANTVFKFQPEPLPNCNVCKSTWLFFWYLDAGLRLIFFRKDFLNSSPHTLTSESYLGDFSVSFFWKENRGMNCDVRVAVHVVGILNSLMVRDGNGHFC